MILGKIARTLVVSTGLSLSTLGLAVYGPAGLGPGSVQAKPERHPHIRAALRELREAKVELERANHDFGGHRKEAIEAMDVAIIQIEKALKYDRR